MYPFILILISVIKLQVLMQTILSICICKNILPDIDAYYYYFFAKKKFY